MAEKPARSLEKKTTVVARKANFVSKRPDVIVETAQRRMTMRQVTDDELDQLTHSSTSVPLTFFGLCLGAAIAFATVVFTTPEDAKNHDLFVVLMWVSGLLSAYFAVRARQAHVAGSDLLKSIRR